MEHNPGLPPKKRRRLWIVLGLIAALMVLCGGGAALLLGSMSSTPAPTSSPTPNVGKTSNPPAAPKPTKAQPAKINGDDLVHVGEDVPAGTYRAASAVVDGDLCYWLKSSDAEGEKILDNDIPTGGRPQVTLKKGEWFKSQGCPDWIRR